VQTTVFQRGRMFFNVASEDRAQPCIGCRRSLPHVFPNCGAPISAARFIAYLDFPHPRRQSKLCSSPKQVSLPPDFLQSARYLLPRSYRRPSAFRSQGGSSVCRWRSESPNPDDRHRWELCRVPTYVRRFSQNPPISSRNLRHKSNS
jgi:hypothetical protein